MTFSCFGSVTQVYITASFRPISPCQPGSALAGPLFSNLWNPYLTFPGGVHYLYGCLYTGMGRPYGGFPDFSYLDPFRPQAPYQLFGTQTGNNDQIIIAVDNTTVVSYINKQGGTPLRLVVDIFLWLQTQDIVLRARHIPGCLNVIADHLSQPNQLIMTEWSLHPENLTQIFGNSKQQTSLPQSTTSIFSRR